LLTFVAVFVSQSVPDVAQWAKPVLQLAIPHLPWLHVGVPFAVVQMLWHVPQLLTSFCRLASQPSAGLLLQSVQPPAWQLTMLQVPALHASVAWFVLQAIPHPPQFSTSPGVPPVFTGQPWIGG
jgi:hypothetical protein